MKRSESERNAVLEEVSKLHATGGINPSEEQLRALIDANRDGPLHFLNLLSYHDAARYPQGHEMASRNLTGAEAYTLYGEVALRHVLKRGGSLVLYNDVEQVIIGRGDDWDHIAILQYPDTEAFVDMIRDPDYVAALVHRDAGLAKTEVLVSRPLVPAAT